VPHARPIVHGSKESSGSHAVYGWFGVRIESGIAWFATVKTLQAFQRSSYHNGSDGSIATVIRSRFSAGAIRASFSGIPRVKLTSIVVPTGVATQGLTVAEAFRECMRCNVQGIPFVNSQGCLAGHFSIRNTIRMACIPNIVIMGADLLGDALDNLMIPDREAARILELAVDQFIMDTLFTIHPDSPCVKAAALMEKHDTTYLFVVDGEEYKGVVNVQGIVRRMLEVGAT
jgi:CBS domain-containing protein